MVASLERAAITNNSLPHPASPVSSFAYDFIYSTMTERERERETVCTVVVTDSDMQWMSRLMSSDVSDVEMFPSCCS